MTTETILMSSCLIVFSENRFEKTFSKVVDEVFLALGAGVRDTIYYHLEKKFQLGREEFYDKIEVFHEALEDMLGEGGRIVEHSIAKSLSRRFGLEFEVHENWTLPEHVKDVKRRLESG
jgi:hypothetical protein